LRTLLYSEQISVLTILANLGPLRRGFLPALQRVVAAEGAALVAADDAPRPDGEILLTLLDDPATIAPVLTPGVRWIHVLGAGVDGFPFESVGDRILTCSRGASAPAISEFVLAAMLAFEKRLPESWIAAPPERWSDARLGGLRGRTLGLVGLGAIGVEVARRALAFEMTVVAVRRNAAAAPLPGIEVLDSLSELLHRADHVVLAAPATPQTHHLLDASALASLKPGAHVVNVARGSLVDQDALVDALDRGIVALASLDVVDPEPLPSGHPLYSHPGVRVSPHISWSSPDTTQRTIELFIDNLRRYRSGQALHGVVDTAAGY
jgi:phosphoglycerate dehydrogenase-like enzyme